MTYWIVRILRSGRIVWAHRATSYDIPLHLHIRHGTSRGPTDRLGVPNIGLEGIVAAVDKAHAIEIAELSRRRMIEAGMWLEDAADRLAGVRCCRNYETPKTRRARLSA